MVDVLFEAKLIFLGLRKGTVQSLGLFFEPFDVLARLLDVNNQIVRFHSNVTLLFIG